MKIDDLKNKKIAILGFGKEGKSTLLFLEKNGIKDISILDYNSIDSKNLNSNYEIFTGPNYLNNLGDFDLIIKTPGISFYKEELLPYKDKIITQINIFFENYHGKVIGITGTKGKSTTSTFLYEVLKDSGYKVALVGNIGNPVLDEIDLNSNYDFIIYEISSYMLEGFSPKLYIGILLNLFKEHTDWHKTEQNYINAKINILKKSKYKLINSSILGFSNLDNLILFGNSGNYIYINDNFYINSIKICSKDSSNIKADHFLINFSSILGCIDIIGKEQNKNLLTNFKNILKTFNPLPHRLENIGTYCGITFIDDAISTTPESTIEAIKTYKNDVETIFLGGTDRFYDFFKLVDFILTTKIKNIVFFPETGEKILKEFLSFGFERKTINGEEFIENLKLCKKIKILLSSSMNEAICFGYKNTSFGKVCLLSTASPSYFLWKNYEQKGEEFKKYVLENSKL